jgi:hypothetical protein
MLASEQSGGATTTLILVVIRGLIYSSGLFKLLPFHAIRCLLNPPDELAWRAGGWLLLTTAATKSSRSLPRV